MNRLAALTLAALVAAGSATTANAFVDPGQPEAPVLASSHVGPDGTVYDPCHGRVSGTAHALCGTATGGPSGGLF